MRRRESRRSEVLERAIDRLLECGLDGLTLRSVAAAAGTSDRMVMYYFRDKEDLLSATLMAMALRVRALLDRAASKRVTYPALLREVGTAFATRELAPYLRVWLELAARAAMGDALARSVGGQIADLFVAWAEERLDVDPAVRHDTASLLLVTLEGAFVLEAVGRGAIAGRAMAMMGALGGTAK